MKTPRSTYRLQIRASFDLDAAADVTDYLRDLGVDWAYLSPLLEATEGSDHGYDVVDPTRVDPARGGAGGLERFAAAARGAGLGILVDIVPNHMGISRPEQNAWWWDVLRRGRSSDHVDAFDIDWEFGHGRICVPVLGDEPDAVLARGEITIDTDAADGAPDGLARYYDNALPLAPGSVQDGDEIDSPDGVRKVLERQHWRLEFWRRENAVLNYRRFFAVTTLAGVRVEDPEVFQATHVEVLRWLREGLADGLRVDHPDGLSDPGGYLDLLAEATGGAYVLVEKILEHSATDHPEQLPSWWRTAGTTGYDALAEIDRVLTDPHGQRALDILDARLHADSGIEQKSWSDLVHGTKQRAAGEMLTAEVRRLVRSLPEPVEDAQDALVELLSCYPVYRSYLPSGREWFEQALAEASARRPDLRSALEALAPALTDGSLEVARRFAQTAGPVMAKGVEDTAFYRYNRLGSLTEVGGDPSVFSLPVEGFHTAQQRRLAAWPHAMTTLSTHDTKRGEDVRTRLAVLAEIPDRWSEVLQQLRVIASTGHGPFDTLLWQAIIGSWPASPERLHAYAEKAAREAGDSTNWWDPDAGFEERMHAVVDAAFGPAREVVESFVDEISAAGWSNALSAKLLQLTGPGVPDVYQGSELWETSLVDPDNRRPVDFAHRRRMLAELDAPDANLPPVDETAAAKLLVTSRALRLRRDRPELFERYRPLTAAGSAAGHVIAADRGGAVAVATRLPAGLAACGGWGDTALLLSEGRWRDELTGREFPGGRVSLADLLQTYPVALLTGIH